MACHNLLKADSMDVSKSANTKRMWPATISFFINKEHQCAASNHPDIFRVAAPNERNISLRSGQYTFSVSRNRCTEIAQARTDAHQKLNYFGLLCIQRFS